MLKEYIKNGIKLKQNIKKLVANTTEELLNIK